MSIKFSDVTLCIPTRGDVDLDPILNTLPDFADVIIYDNLEREDDLGIYGRYWAAFFEADTDIVATQDDDLIVTCWDQILAAHEPGQLTVNYPEPYDIPWVARGAIFERQLAFDTFKRYWTVHPQDRFFTHYACDGILGLLHPNVKVIDGGSEDLPAGNAEGRISTSPGWYDDKRPLIQKRCEEILCRA